MRFATYAWLLAIALVIVACGQNSSTVDQQAADSAAAQQAVAGANKDGIDTSTFTVTDTTITLRNGDFPTPSGRVVNVMVTGLDSRLGDPMGHADANHLVRFFLDSGCIEIISIPRDTPHDAGFEDTTGLNKLTNVRANRGRAAYHVAAAEIAGVSKIDYWVEFGFSQAIGLLELMGYKENASSTLRVLRSRQAYAAGDYQRVYNQGQFIRQIILRAFDQTDNLLGELALRASLALVETNLTYDACDQMLDALRARGFSDADPSRIWVRLKPSLITKLKVYSFDSANVNAIDQQITQKISRLGLDSVPVNAQTYERRLYNLVQKAAADSARSAGSVIRLLRRPYEQRAWLQVKDLSKRKMYRDRICGMLIASYRRVKNPDAAKRIEDYIAIEDRVNANR